MTELGHDVFSLHGAYQNGQGDGKRPSIPSLKFQSHLHDVAMQCDREKIHQEIIDWTDVIIVMHMSQWIESNWPRIRHKKVIWRTIGQSTEHDERSVSEYRKDGMKIIRMSPVETNIQNYQGSDTVIRFYKDENEFFGYTGITPRVVNVSQAMFGNIMNGGQVRSRGDHMRMDILNHVLKDFTWKIYGPDNEDAGEHNGGTLSYEDYKSMLKFNKVFFYTGTQPSPYTLSFIEAMMTGIPIVSIGKQLGSSVYGQKTWEIDKIIKNGVNGYVSDDPIELKMAIKELLENPEKARAVGHEGRMTAIKYFGKSNIKEDWKKFLENL